MLQAYLRECEHIPAESVPNLYLTLGEYRDLLSEHSLDPNVVEVLPLMDQLVLSLRPAVGKYCACPCHSSKCSDTVTVNTNATDPVCLLLGARTLVVKLRIVLEREGIIPQGTCEVCNRFPAPDQEDINRAAVTLSEMELDECILERDNLKLCTLRSKFRQPCNGSNPVALHGALMYYVNQTLQRLDNLPNETLSVVRNITTFLQESIIPITEPIADKKCNNSCGDQKCTLDILEDISSDLESDLRPLQCPMRSADAAPTLPIYCLMSIIRDNFFQLKRVLEDEELRCATNAPPQEASAESQDEGNAQQTFSTITFFGK